MVYINTNLCKFCRALEWKMLVYCIYILKYVVDIWYILWSFGNYVVVWYISPRFGILCQEKSGIPAMEANVVTNTFLKVMVTKWLFNGGSTRNVF
jgi:hypothetical protein